MKSDRQKLIETSKELRRSSNAVSREFVSATAQVYDKLCEEFKSSEEYRTMRNKLRDLGRQRAIAERSVRRMVRKYMRDHGLVSADEIGDMDPLIRKYVRDSMVFQKEDCFALQNVSMFIY